MDWTVQPEAIDALFSSTIVNTQDRLDALAVTVLGQGIDHYQSQKYDLAINAFKRAAALSPFTDNAAKAYNYIGQAYLKQEKTDAAIKTYQQAMRIYPQRPEFRIALGDIYTKEGMHAEALAQYEAAAKFDPENAESLYSLGQAYLAAGDLRGARDEFREVVRLTPTSAAGHYGLGQTARAEGETTKAVLHLQQALRVNRGFELAYVELGKVYADMGEFEKAEDLVRTLAVKQSDKKTTLQKYIEEARAPQITQAYSPNGFSTLSGAKTKVSALHPAMASAGRSKLFSMNVSFSKDMDINSIINPANWKISRATIKDNGGVYNKGLTPPATEVLIMPRPAYVLFDEKTNTATVNFWISQNDNADATIDPRHIVFKFSGMDAYGKAMDTSADEYSGFSGIA